jgi:hypothetical protein
MGGQELLCDVETHGSHPFGTWYKRYPAGESETAIDSPAGSAGRSEVDGRPADGLGGHDRVTAGVEVEEVAGEDPGSALAGWSMNEMYRAP